jgi:hypothetical protein
VTDIEKEKVWDDRIDWRVFVCQDIWNGRDTRTKALHIQEGCPAKCGNCTQSVPNCLSLHCCRAIDDITHFTVLCPMLTQDCTPYSRQQHLLQVVTQHIWHSDDRAAWNILIMKANEMHCFSDLIDKVLYMFRTGPLSIIRSISTLYTHNSYLSCWNFKGG